MNNIFRFPGAPDPAPESDQPTSADPFALLENFGRALMDVVGDMTVGEALEQLSRQPAKAILGAIFQGWHGDDQAR
jgi:hypothetical protein